jgi:NAD(P)H-dependent nitrite reductase small subunit
MSISTQAATTTVCRLDDLVPGRGAAALVGGVQIAVFRIGPAEVLAVQQHDPFSGAAVMSRGIVGTRGDAVTVASPMYKQVFDLRTGKCLDGLGAEPRDLQVWAVTITPDGLVQVVAR